MKKNMEQAAIYLRLSKEDMEREEGEDSKSIENQRNILIAYAKAHSFTIYDTYVDDDFSGLYWERPAFSRMISEAQEHRFSVILAKSQSRLSRNMEHAEYILHDLLPSLGIRFIGVVDGVDTSQKSGKKARQINALVNEWYSEDLSESIRAVYKRKMQCGEYLGAYAPYGYQKSREDSHRLVIDEEAAQWVRNIFTWYAAGYSIQSILTILEKEKVPTPINHRNKEKKRTYDSYQWSASTIKKILSNEVYLGKVIQGKSERKSFKDKQIVPLPREKWIVVEGMHEPIISEELFHLVRQRRKRH